MRAFIAGALFVLSAGACGAEPGIEELAWLAGCWKAENAEPGSGEQWTLPAGGAMLGTSRTIRQGEMVEFEFMQVRTRDDGALVFIAQPSGSAPTEFPLKALDASGVTFENLEHDFPQRVLYSPAAGGNIAARIEGMLNGVVESVDYPMVRVDCDEQFGRR